MFHWGLISILWDIFSSLQDVVHLSPATPKKPQGRIWLNLPGIFLSWTSTKLIPCRTLIAKAFKRKPLSPELWNWVLSIFWNTVYQDFSNYFPGTNFVQLQGHLILHNAIQEKLQNYMASSLGIWCVALSIKIFQILSLGSLLYTVEDSRAILVKCKQHTSIQVSFIIYSL